ncbi:MAG: hypothetical protein Q9184_006779, partial [Pyrenodesmia sp. 2 TL-2023]
YQIMLDEQEASEASMTADKEMHKSLLPTPSDTQSLTDASTIDDSTVVTPYFGIDEGSRSSKRKRKAAPSSFKLDMISLEDPGLPASPREQVEINSSPTTRAKRKVSPESKKIKSSSKRFRRSAPS